MSKESLNLDRGVERANALTHLLGAVLSIIGLIMMLGLAEVSSNYVKLKSSLIFGISSILLYLASTVYHSVFSVKLKSIFKIVDHSAIFVLIAGTYTPFALIALKNEGGYFLFNLLWLITLVGTLYKIFFSKRFKILSTIIYLSIGWLAVAYMKPIYENIGALGFIWLIAGGAFYSLGTIFYMGKRKYSHSIWHLFVLGGTISHFISIYYFVLRM
ncbi:MAG: hemolysin III family protein [Bacteroidota bacterium]